MIDEDFLMYSFSCPSKHVYIFSMDHEQINFAECLGNCFPHNEILKINEKAPKKNHLIKRVQYDV